MKYGLLITSDTYVASNSLFENEPILKEVYNVKALLRISNFGF